MSKDKDIEIRDEFVMVYHYELMPKYKKAYQQHHDIEEDKTDTKPEPQTPSK